MKAPKFTQIAASKEDELYALDDEGRAWELFDKGWKLLPDAVHPATVEQIEATEKAFAEESRRLRAPMTLPHPVVVFGIKIWPLMDSEGKKCFVIREERLRVALKERGLEYEILDPN